MTTDGLLRSQQRLLYAAIDDIGEAVRGNDAKAYAALVLHGLILAGITSLITSLGAVYHSASTLERVYGLEFLATAFCCFLMSAWFLINAVSPYRPYDMESRIKHSYAHVFFPTDVLQDGHPDPHRVTLTRLDQMGEHEIRSELVAETLKLAKILEFESNQTATGYFWLRCELCATAAFLVIAAISALR